MSMGAAVRVRATGLINNPIISIYYQDRSTSLVKYPEPEKTALKPE